MSFPTRKIGNDDVSEIGFGLMGLSAFYGPIASDEERFTVLDAAVEEGCTFWDTITKRGSRLYAILYAYTFGFAYKRLPLLVMTADIYGDSEEFVGKWFKRTGKRNKIFLATKFGFVLDKVGVVDARPEYVKTAAELSMKKLGVDVIDLYYLHRADPQVPIEKTVGAMAELVKEGKVRYLGLSEISANTLRRAHAVHPIAAVQVEYSPFCLEIESEKIGLLEACRELGVAVIAYSPLGRGMLTGVYKSHDDIPENDFRRMLPKYSKENFPNILKLVDGIQQVAKKRDVTPGQVTLAWLLAQGNDIIPIPGTKKIKYLKENLDSAKIKLSREEVAEVREIAEKAGALLGPSYPPEWMALSFADTPPL